MWYATDLIPMTRIKKQYEDDDGRVIASMLPTQEKPASSHAPKELPAFTPKERRLYALAALKAALLIAAAFLGGLALVIWLITLL